MLYEKVRQLHVLSEWLAEVGFRGLSPQVSRAFFLLNDAKETGKYTGSFVGRVRCVEEPACVLFLPSMGCEKLLMATIRL